MRALRRNLMGDHDAFPQDVLELIGYLGPLSAEQPVRAIPGAGTEVPVWILGSSLYGAQLAAALGLPYAFASHFAPAQLEPAIAVYRERFRPSPHLATPRQRGYSRRINRPSSISVPAGPGHCRHPSMRSKRFLMTAAGRF
jgi:hypothetical protein